MIRLVSCAILVEKMPILGEIQQAYEIGYKGSNQRIWLSCERCGKERWVRLLNGKPCHKLCAKCHQKDVAYANRGNGNGQWRGGRWIDKKGYVYILNHAHPYCHRGGYVLEHRLVMEDLLGRYLLPTEEVHHKDENPQNNIPSNLLLFETKGKHIVSHFRANPTKYKASKRVHIKGIRCPECQSSMTYIRRKASELVCRECGYINIFSA